MDPTIAQQLAAAWGQSIQSNNDQSARAAQRQADSSAALMQGIAAGGFQAILNANVPTQTADLNTAAHAPVPQPWVTPGFVYNPAAVPAGGKQPGS